MSATGLPEQSPWLVPILTVKDVDLYIDFLARAFDFEPGPQVRDASGTALEAELRYRGQLLLMVVREGSGGSNARAPNSAGTPSPVTLQVRSADVHALADRARTAGASILEGPSRQDSGVCNVLLRDLDGHCWCFVSPSST